MASSVVLLPETVARQNGATAELALGNSRLVRLTLGITRIIEQESLDVSVWGSVDREHWTYLAAFPHKSYCGTYALSLDLRNRAEICFVRAQWTMGKWSHHESPPLFEFYISAEEGLMLQHAGAM